MDIIVPAEFLGQLSLGCCVVNQQRLVIYANPFAQQLFEYVQQPLVGSQIADILEQIGASAAIHRVERVLDGHSVREQIDVMESETAAVISIYQQANGAIITFTPNENKHTITHQQLQASYRHRLEEEVNQQTAKLNVNITERKLADQMLAELQSRLHLFIRANSDMLYRMNADWSEMYELDGKDFLANTKRTTKNWINRYIPKEEHARIWQTIANAVQQKINFELEHKLYKADGNIGWTYSRAVPALNAAGKIVEWFGMARDITPKKEAELQLFKNYTLLQQSEQLAAAGTWDYDLLTKSFTWSEGMYHLFGLTVGDKVSPEIYIDYATAECLHIAEQIARCTRSPTLDFAETIEIIVNNKIKVLRLKATVIRNELNEPIRVLGVDMDITTIRETERQLHDLQAKQQQEIFRATLNAQEQERRRISESLHNGLGQVLYGTKLALNILSAKLVTDNPEKFTSAKKHADNLLNDAIKESRRLSHELIPTVLAEFGLEAAISEICRQMQDGVKYRCNVHLDPIQLDSFLEIAVFRTVQELMLNISKHAEAKLAVIDVSNTANELVVLVTDNGKGMDVENSKGNGIGLSSIQSKVGLLNGSILIESIPGRYTSVEVRLPLYQTLTTENLDS